MWWPFCLSLIVRKLQTTVLLELLAEKNVPMAMSILTSPDVIDGVTWGEVSWAQGYEVESLAVLLQDDIDALLVQELLTEKGPAGINELIEMGPRVATSPQEPLTPYHRVSPGEAPRCGSLTPLQEDCTLEPSFPAWEAAFGACDGVPNAGSNARPCRC